MNHLVSSRHSTVRPSLIIRTSVTIAISIIFVILLLVDATTSATATSITTTSTNSSIRQEEGCPLTSSLQLSRPPPNNVTTTTTTLAGHGQANVFFTVLLPQLDCQSDALQRRDTLIYLNAISYALDLLNGEQPHGSDGHSSIKQYLPLLHRQPTVWSAGQLPLRFGAKLVTVPRSAGDGAAAAVASSPTTLTCTPKDSAGDAIHDLAFLDAAHLFDKHANNALLEQIPIISLSSKESILTTSFKANLIVNLLDTLNWKHFAIITTRHEDSLYIVKILGQIAHSGHVCISDIFEWTKGGDGLDSGDDDGDEHLAAEKVNTEERLGHFLKSVYRANTKIPILIVSNDETQVSQLVQMLYKNFPSEIANHQLFFSLVPSPELLTQLQLLSNWGKVFTLTSHLPVIPQASSNLLSNLEACKAVDEASEAIANSDMWRKWLSFLPIRSMLSLAMALDNAVRNTCGNVAVAATTNSAHNDNSSRSAQKQTPWCADLGKLDRKVFFEYLSELEDKIESTWMTVGAIDTTGRFNDLLLYNGDEFRVMKSNYSVEESTCVSSDCNSCIKFRQSRNDDQDEHGGNLNENNVRHLYGINKLFADREAAGGHDGHNNLHILLNEEESSAVPVEEADEESAVLHVETHEINLGLLLPLHQNGASILECSTELNLPAYYIYEAARWIIDKINQNNYLIPGIEIKLELIDTCSSPFYATQELAHLTSSDAKVQPIAFVSSLPRDHYKQVVDFVSSINYTLIATQDISFMDLKFGSRFGILQTSATSQNLIRALVEQLKYFGWRYISVVVDPNDLYSMSMLHYLNELTNSEKICFASVEELSDPHVNVTMMHLLENYKNGANVVVLLTSYESSANLMAYYQSTVKLGVLKSENLHFVAIRDQNLEMVHGFEEEYLGSIFIRESIGRMNHFDNHFLDLLANPKKEQLLYQFINQCGSNSAQCLRLINSFDRTVAANTMQAILAIVGGFARMRNETCADEQGICNKMLESNFHRSLLSYILNTRSMRIDSQSDRRFKSDNYDVFEFSPDGSSGRDVEILNFKHDFTNGLFRFDTVALYVHNTKTLMRNPNVRYIFYKYNGVVNGHKEYNETELITSDCVNLKKCSQCQPQTPEFIYMPSWDNLILTGIFNVHLHSEQNPLICQKNFTLVESVQNVEAFLWTIDLINNDPHVLPGVHLGALIFDSCNSYQKIYRDISNFLSNSLLLGDSNVQIPMADSVMGFVVDGKNTKIVDSILDLTAPLKISVLTTEARESKYNDLKHYPQFLGFSLPNKFHVDAIFNILRNYSWTFVSAVYENNLNEQQYSDAFEYFSSSAEKHGVRLAVQELFDESNLVESVANLKSMATLGARVVVLFLSPENLRNFLYFNEMVKSGDQNKLLPSDVLYIVIDSQNVLQIFSHLNISAISVSQDRKIVPEFQEHFLDLSLQTNVKNPWFTRLWEKVYGCEGFGCYRTSGSLRQRNVTINEKTGAIINSVYTLAHSLELTRQNLCPNTFNGLCRNFVSHLRQVSKMEHDAVKENEFVGLDGSRIAFDHDSNYITGHLNVLNWQQVDKSGTRTWVQVGHFDAENGLLMASSKTRAYLAHGSAASGVTFSKVVSQCQASNSKCSKVNGENGGSAGPILPPFMGATEESRANIALVVPLHETDGNSKCGPINSEMFEKLMAFQFALDQSPVHLGVIVLDSCSYSKQHLQQLASAHNYKLLPKIVSIVNLLEANHLNLTISNQLFNMIGDYSPLVYNLFKAKAAQEADRQSFFFNEKSTANENANHILRSIVDLCSRSKWPVVNLVYSNEFSKNYFLFEANQNNICVDKTMSVTLKDIAKPQFRSDWATFTASLDSQITVVLTNADLIEYLIKYSDKETLDRIVWVGDKNLKTGADNVRKSLKKSFQNMVTVKKAATSIDSMPVASVIDGLSSYFDVNNANARSRSKAVTNWLYEYWHRKFNCLLNAKKQEKACFEVKNARKALSNTQELKHVIDFAQVLSKSISKFVTGKCNSSSDDCIYNVQLRNELKNSLIDDLNKNNYLNDIRKVNAESNYQVEVASNHGATLNTFTSFNLMNVSSLVATNLSDGQSVLVSAVCRSSCDYCRTQLLQSRNRSNHLLSSDSLQSPLTSNMSAHRTWAIAASIFSTLGLIVVLICVLYFILIFPIALGTTIIGYQILVGLFLCYLANFAYLLPSTNSLCWVREFGLPIAYCVILSGLFVKVYNYWCQVLMKKSTKPLAYNSPMTLLSISFLFVLIQVSIIAFLTYKYPGNYSAFANTLLCSSNTKFALLRPETVLPLLLLALLFVLTLFFSVKTIDNLESRWILICSALSALTWLAWIGFDTLYRDAKPISIVVANIIVATLYIVLLYIRKLYLFSKISRKILKERRVNMDANLQYEPFAEYQQQQQYGAFRSCTENISWSNIQDKANYRNATRSPFEGDTEGDNVSSCGSVKSNGSSQVQCQELYPMEVYDNAGQNQLVNQQSNARVGQSTRSIYDIIDDASFK
ncbi:hypothetical protein TYRP_007134 [Tyrophagus putrescentiae]|nr:hypothetical protein TYRP_007134 [Tyrophagus putrescentiae]